LLLLAVLDLIDEGKASPARIPWCQELRDRFSARFLRVRKHNDQNTPENPFFYLQTQGFWQAWIEEAGRTLPLQTTPLVNQMGKTFARFEGGMALILQLPSHRQSLREALIARYFPQLADELPAQEGQAKEEPTAASRVADESAEYGRSPAFRRLILDIYDHQCAACGLRIHLSGEKDVSFIDAAHLIPFSVSRNDHPTNGLALCKNHHWAMDRDIIAPGPDLHWHISPAIDPRRSNGERELHELSGKSLLLPKDPAFHPDEKGLEWRCDRLIA
jgi:putative restriction endonuclease